MDFATLTTPAAHASGPPTIAPPAIGLAHHPVLALDLGTTTGWALRSQDGGITSGTMTFKPSRFEGGVSVAASAHCDAGGRCDRSRSWTRRRRRSTLTTLIRLIV